MIVLLLITLGLTYKGVGITAVENIYNSNDLIMTACKQLTSMLAVNSFTMTMTCFIYIVISVYLFIEIPYMIYKLVKGVFVND